MLALDYQLPPHDRYTESHRISELRCLGLQWHLASLQPLAVSPDILLLQAPALLLQLFSGICLLHLLLLYSSHYCKKLLLKQLHALLLPR